MPFEVAVWCLRLVQPVKKGEFLAVFTYDDTGRLAAQLLSSRLGVGINVFMGFYTAPEGEAGLQIVRSWVLDLVGPAITDADTLAPVNWNQATNKSRNVAPANNA